MEVGEVGELEIFSLLSPLPNFPTSHPLPLQIFPRPNPPQLPNLRWRPNMKMYTSALKICQHYKLVVACLVFTLTCLVQSSIKHLDAGLYPWLA